MPKTFSERHGYRPTDAEILVREDAPPDLRHAILQIAKHEGLSPRHMRRIVCDVLLVRPDPNNWSEYPNIWEEVNRHMEECDWYQIYDVAEAFYEALKETRRESAREFRERLNRFFREKGIGWEMRAGKILFRGSDSFAKATREATEILKETGRSVAENEVQEAIRDISRRPKPDRTGAIQHAMAALEATARDVIGQPKPTLGKLVSKLNLPQPLDGALGQLWGYASQRGRHVQEGQSIDTFEVELLVSVACSLSTFIIRRSQASRSAASR